MVQAGWLGLVGIFCCTTWCNRVLVATGVKAEFFVTALPIDNSDICGGNLLGQPDVTNRSVVVSIPFT